MCGIGYKNKVKSVIEESESKLGYIHRNHLEYDSDILIDEVNINKALSSTVKNLNEWLDNTKRHGYNITTHEDYQIRVDTAKYKLSYTENGPLKMVRDTRPWASFECFEFPKSCNHCPMGWNKICSIDDNIKNSSIT